VKLRSALVVGSTGFIGSTLVRKLAERGIEVHCLLRNTAKTSHLCAVSGIHQIVVTSFRSCELHEALRGISCEVVFNLAAYGVNQQDRDPELMLEGNVNLAGRLLVATAGWHPRWFIQAGSCSEYGLGTDHDLIREDHPLQPLSVYGAAKAGAVLYGAALAGELGVRFVTLRLFGVYGDGEAPQRLVPYLIASLKRNQPAKLTPGEQERDFLHVEDVAEAFLAAANSNRLVPLSAYNVCSSRPVRVREIGEMVAAIMEKPRELLQWGERPYRPDEPMWLVGDNSRFTSTTGWQPKVSLREGLERLIGAS
jgi:nucleoside-diphosphate-sugar epimerase